jgi:hypothetical protein
VKIIKILGCWVLSKLFPFREHPKGIQIGLLDTVNVSHDERRMN